MPEGRAPIFRPMLAAWRRLRASWVASFDKARQTQDFSQRKAVSAAPFQAEIAVYAFKITDQQHAEVATWRQRWAAATRRI
jgi:hypothetical protein